MAEVIEMEDVRCARRAHEHGAALKREDVAMAHLAAAWAERHGVSGADFHRAEDRYQECRDDFIKACAELDAFRAPFKE
jgi:hypothetical protein